MARVVVRLYAVLDIDIVPIDWTSELLDTSAFAEQENREHELVIDAVMELIASNNPREVLSVDEWEVLEYEEV